EMSPPARSRHGHTATPLPLSHCPRTLGRCSLLNCGGCVVGRWLRRGVALILLAVLLATAGPMRAQGADDLAALSREVSRLHGQGRYAEAVPLAERYVALAHRKHGDKHLEFATAISWLCELYSAQGRYAEA